MAAGDGLISMTPTSVDHSGTSASINADGGVDFSAVTSLSLNGVFTGDYDNYLVVLSGFSASGDAGLRWRLRASGTDASGTDYVQQLLAADTTNLQGARFTSQQQASLGNLGPTLLGGTHGHCYGPFLAQPTAFRTVSMIPIDGNGTDNPKISDRASTHSLSTSYDGMSVIASASTITGNIHVFGYEE